MKDLRNRLELEKVREAQEKRRVIKSIRQEAFELQAMRKKKADDHRMHQIEESIRIKDEKCAAIQRGYATLTFMRNKMKDIVGRASVELKVCTWSLQTEAWG